MLLKPVFLAIFEAKCGKNVAFSDDILYNMYQKLHLEPLNHYNHIVELIEKLGIDAIILDVRRFYAERGTEMTPRETEEWLYLIWITRENRMS